MGSYNIYTETVMLLILYIQPFNLLIVFVLESMFCTKNLLVIYSLHEKVLKFSQKKIVPLHLDARLARCFPSMEA